MEGHGKARLFGQKKAFGIEYDLAKNKSPHKNKNEYREKTNPTLFGKKTIFKITRK